MSEYTEIAELLKKLNEVKRRSVESYKAYIEKLQAILAMMPEGTKICETCGDITDGQRWCDSACAYEHELNMQENVIAKGK